MCVLVVEMGASVFGENDLSDCRGCKVESRRPRRGPCGDLEWSLGLVSGSHTPSFLTVGKGKCALDTPSFLTVGKVDTPFFLTLGES